MRKDALPKKSAKSGPLDLGRALADAFLTNDQVNQMLIDLIDPGIWRAQPPCSKRRSIATSFAHIHNVRVMQIGMFGSKRRPARLDRGEVTPATAKRALMESAQAMARLIEESAAGGGRVKGFPPGIATLVCASVNHEAHHRGQICHWARELGAPISASEQVELWDWNKQWKAAVNN
jgi:uncharacterized damage-inducible protein DinB